MHRMISIGLSILTGLVGMFLPVFTGPELSTAFINVFWETVYGLGFFAAELLFGPMHPGPVGFSILIFGMIVWPIAIMAALYRIMLSILRKRSRTAVIILAALFVISLSYNVRIGGVPGTFVQRLPLYSGFLDI